MDTQVLIVGAGPTGLMLANQLMRRGVRALLVDRHAGPARETRALGVQARTLEIYTKLGIAKRAVELGKVGDGANLWANGRRTAHIPLGDAGRELTAFPYILVLGQDDNERLLGDNLRALGSDVCWNTELVTLEPKPDRVRATLRGPDGAERVVEARWVAGCDGAHSGVRELNGIGFPGAPYEHVFYVADTRATGGMVPGQVNVYLWRDGFHLFFPLRGTDHWRVVGILPPGLRGRDDVRFEDVLPSIRAEAGRALAFESCSWFSTYRIHHRAAERFRAGRCFLLGDAAHIHSPVGAQGMNTGLQDAYNLSWKLARVVRGESDESLLDTYEAERLPVAQRLLKTTDRGFRLIVADNAIAGLLRTQVVARVAALAMRNERIQRFAFRTVSQIGIHYRDGALAESAGDWPRNAPQPGDRFPWLSGFEERLDDTRFNLVVVGQGAPDASALGLGDAVRVHVLENDAAAVARAQIPPRACFLLRPDGHIGYASRAADVAAIRRHVERRYKATLRE